MTIPRPRKVFTIASASARPSANSMATTVTERTSVTPSDDQANGSSRTCWKFWSPTKAWPGIWKS